MVPEFEIHIGAPPIFLRRNRYGSKGQEAWLPGACFSTHGGI